MKAWDWNQKQLRDSNSKSIMGPNSRGSTLPTPSSRCDKLINLIPPNNSGQENGGICRARSMHGTLAILT